MTDFLIAIEPWADWWLAILWRASWQGGIVLAIAWAIARFCTLMSPRVVCWVWRLACLKLLVAVIWLQPLAIPVWSPQTPASVATPEAGHAPAVSASDALPTPVKRVVPLSVGAGEAIGGNAVVALVLLLWLVGVSGRLTQTVLQWLAVRRLCRSATGVPSPVACDLLAREADRLGVKRLPELRVSSQAQGPLMAGIWRPLILLPEAVEDRFDPRELRLMLAHELAHVKRRDLAWNWLPTAVGWLFFFHPLVWLMTRGWSESQEAACDELLIQRQVAAPAEYGRLLVKLAARWPWQPQPQLAVASVLGTYQNMERRILAMTRVKQCSFRSLAITFLVLSIVAAPGIVPWQLVTRSSQRNASAVELGAGEPAAAANAGPLPGTIYAEISLKAKTATGEVEKFSGVIAIDPNTGAWKKIGSFGHSLRVSPDGERIAYSEFKQLKPQLKDRDWSSFVVDLKTLAAVKVVDVGSLPVWSPDGKELLYHLGEMKEETGWRGANWVIDLATKQTRKLPIPEEDEVDDWNGNGNWLVTVSDRHPPFGSGYQLYVMHPDGSEQRRITNDDGLNCYPRIRPDGKQIVYNHQGGGFDTLWVVDIDGSNRKKIRSSDKDGHNSPHGAHWSPDGKWLAVYVFDWTTEAPGLDNPKKEFYHVLESSHDRIEIIAADGSNPRLLTLQDVTKVDWINSVDWR